MLDKIPHFLRKTLGIGFHGMFEPFLNPECAKMISYADSFGYPIDISTTAKGMMLDDVKTILHLKNRGNIAIHIPDQEGMPHFQVTDTYIEILQTLLKNSVNYNLHGPIHNDLKTKITLKPNQQLYSRAGNIKELKPKRITGNFKCNPTGLLINRNTVLPNGDVIVCCNDYNMDHIFGNLLTDSYEDLYTSNSYKQAQQAFFDESIFSICRYCNNVSR